MRHIDLFSGIGGKMIEVHMTLSTDPVAKGRPRFSNRGGFVRAYTPSKTIKAERSILELAMPYKPIQPLQHSAHVEMDFYMPIPKSMSKKERTIAAGDTMPHIKKPDLDNLEKLVLDALVGDKRKVPEGIFFRDDSIIYSVVKRKFYSENPRIEVTIVGY
jgi:Holliday junction resolvase RusA-like endonuclease